MICKEVQKKINAYLNKELNEKQLLAFELHTKDCASCQYLIGEVKSTMAILDRSETLSADPFMFTRIQAQIGNRSTERNRNWQKVLQPLAITLILFLGLFIGISLGSKYYNDSLQLNAEEYVLDIQDGDLYFNALAFESIESFLLTE